VHPAILVEHAVRREATGFARATTTTTAAATTAATLAAGLVTTVGVLARERGLGARIGLRRCDPGLRVGSRERLRGNGLRRGYDWHAGGQGLGIECRGFRLALRLTVLAFLLRLLLLLLLLLRLLLLRLLVLALLLRLLLLLLLRLLLRL